MARFLLPLGLIAFLLGSLYLGLMTGTGTELPTSGSTGTGLVQD